jgi:hypothetical protein
VDPPYSDLPEIINEELTRNNYPTQLEPGAILVARLVAGDNLVAFSPKDAITNEAGLSSSSTGLVMKSSTSTTRNRLPIWQPRRAPT